MVELNLSRQEKLVPTNIINEYTLKVFGVGSVGSHFVNVASKTGFKNIEVYDMDIVEEENIAAQAFSFEHLGLNKVEAIADIVKRGANIDIVTYHGQITEDTIITPEANTIYCCFFDSFEARKLIFDKIKDYPVIFVDARIGLFNMRHYLVNCSDEEERKNYAKSLETKAVSELACGEKACAPINSIIAGKLVMNILNYIKGKDYLKMHVANGETPSTDMNILKIREVNK